MFYKLYCSESSPCFTNESSPGFTSPVQVLQHALLFVVNAPVNGLPQGGGIKLTHGIWHFAKIVCQFPQYGATWRSQTPVPG
jgi:hypothetical protein